MKRSTTVAGVRREPSLGAASLALTATQQLLLERLEFIASCDGPIIAMSGAPGSGKTTLALQFLEAADGANAALVSLNGPIASDDLRRQLVWQLLGDRESQPGEMLADIFETVASEERLLLVIDGGQYLTSAQFDEIGDLVRDGELQPGRRVALLVVERDGGQPPEWMADPLITPLLIEPLPVEERAQLWRAKAGALSDQHSDQQLLPWLERVAPTLGHAVRLAEAGMGPGSRQGDDKKARPPLALIAGLVALLLVVGGWLLWPTEQSAPEQAATPVSVAIPLPEEPALAGENTVVEPLPDSGQWATTDTATLDAEGRARAALRIEVPASEVDRAVADYDAERMTGEGETAASVPVAADSEPTASASVAAEPVAEEIAPVPAPTETVEAQSSSVSAAQPAAIPTPVKPQTGKAFYLEPGSAYTIQFGAMRNEAGLRSFAQKQLGKGSAPWAILRSQRDGQPWFVLIQGRYATADSARAAIAKLSSAQRASGPWPKALAVVHQTPFTVVAEQANAAE